MRSVGELFEKYRAGELSEDEYTAALKEHARNQAFVDLAEEMCAKARARVFAAQEELKEAKIQLEFANYYLEEAEAGRGCDD